VLLGLKATTLLTGLSIVFIWKQKNAKPAFVKAIWVLIVLAEVAVIANLILYSRLKKLIEHKDEGYEDIWPYYVVTWTIVMSFVSAAHWIFSTKYLEVVLLLPLLMEHGRTDLQKK